ncbi:MAG TPA: hypothetical protein VGC19_04795 [Rhodanobacter sp.]
MKWITTKYLQSEFGLSWMDAEKVIGEQITLLRNRLDWRGVLVGCLSLLSLFWVSFGARLVAPSMHGWRLAVLELPGLMIAGLVLFVLPRLLAGESIVSAAAALISRRDPH